MYIYKGSNREVINLIALDVYYQDLPEFGKVGKIFVAELGKFLMVWCAIFLHYSIIFRRHEFGVIPSFLGDMVREHVLRTQ